MDDSQFEGLAEGTLARLQTAIEAAAGGAIDTDLIGGILTLEVEGGRTYQINKHLPSQQLWLSSPVSGAWHFAWRAGSSGAGQEQSGAWIATRGGERLQDLLARDLSQSLGEAIKLG